MEELITIIIPVYNTKEYIPECLDSIINQTYKNIRVLLVDDGSTDGSQEVENKYSNVDKRILFLPLEHHGVSYTRNKGLEYCFDHDEIDLITFVDSDDYLEYDYIQRLYETKKKYNADVSCCMLQTEGLNKKGTLEDKLYTRKEAVYNYFHDKVFFESPCLKLMSKKYYKNVRFNSFRYYEDTYICYQLLEQFDSVAYIDYYGYINRDRAGSAVRSPFSNNSYDKVNASKEIYKHYIGTEFETLAFNKYLGSLLYFIIKTNGNKEVTKNPEAIQEVKEVISSNGFKNVKRVFVPFIIASKLGILRFIKVK